MPTVSYHTGTEPFIVNPYHTRYNGEHITAMVISIISDAKNVFMPNFQLFYLVYSLHNSLAHPPYGIRSKLEATRLVELVAGT